MYHTSLYHRNGGIDQGLTPEQIRKGLQTRVEKVNKSRSIERISYEHQLYRRIIGESVVDLTQSGVNWFGFLPHEHHHYNGEARKEIGLLAHLQIYQDLRTRQLEEECRVNYASLKPYSYTDFLELLKEIGVRHRMQFKDCLERLVTACEQERLIKL